jgi:hypothetical protein
MKKSEMRSLWNAADAAGKAAANAKVPVPMVVVERANPLNDNSAIVKRYAPIAGGVCGFAWLSIRPANSAFVNWLKKQGIGRLDTYAGGWKVWCGDYSQSMEKKEAYVNTVAKVLREAGINAYGESRMD